MWKIQHPGGQREIDSAASTAWPAGAAGAGIGGRHPLFSYSGFPGDTGRRTWTLHQPVVHAGPDRVVPYFLHRILRHRSCGDGRLGHRDARRSTISTGCPHKPPEQSLAAQGAEIYRAHGCSGCHRGGNGEGGKQAPPLIGIYGHDVPLEGGRTVRWRTSVTCAIQFSCPSPRSSPVMSRSCPSFTGQISEEELVTLIAYLGGAG